MSYIVWNKKRLKDCKIWLWISLLTWTGGSTVITSDSKTQFLISASPSVFCLAEISPTVIWLYFMQIQNTGFILAGFFVSAVRHLPIRWVDKPVHFIRIVVVGACVHRWLFRPLCSACQGNIGVLLHQNIVVKTLWIFWKRTVTMNSGKEVHLWGVLHIVKRKRYLIGQFLSIIQFLELFFYVVSTHPYTARSSQQINQDESRKRCERQKVKFPQVVYRGRIYNADNADKKKAEVELTWKTWSSIAKGYCQWERRWITFSVTAYQESALFRNAMFRCQNIISLVPTGRSLFISWGGGGGLFFWGPGGSLDI